MQLFFVRNIFQDSTQSMLRLNLAIAQIKVFFIVLHHIFSFI